MHKRKELLRAPDDPGTKSQYEASTWKVLCEGLGDKVKYEPISLLVQVGGRTRGYTFDFSTGRSINGKMVVIEIHGEFLIRDGITARAYLGIIDAVRREYGLHFILGSQITRGELEIRLGRVNYDGRGGRDAYANAASIEEGRRILRDSVDEFWCVPQIEGWETLLSRKIEDLKGRSDALNDTGIEGLRKKLEEVRRKIRETEGVTGKSEEIFIDVAHNNEMHSKLIEELLRRNATRRASL